MTLNAFLITICGKFTRAQLAHQIFLVGICMGVPLGCQISGHAETIQMF
jgi:hypothetical protein